MAPVEISVVPDAAAESLVRALWTARLVDAECGLDGARGWLYCSQIYLIFMSWRIGGLWWKNTRGDKRRFFSFFLGNTEVFGVLD